MKNLLNLINRSLDRYLPSEKYEPRNLHRAMRYSVFSGGKRIRPMIVVESCKACGGSVHDAMPAACAVELIHAYSLIHDDLPSMDDDDYRRGRPSCHKAFGEAAAILAGDALLTLAFTVIAENYEPKRCASMVAALSGAIGTRGMVGGQALDIEPGKKKDKSAKRLINSLKTAKLFEVSAGLGAIAAGAKQKEIITLARYGAYLGEAFQITDDILDGESGFSVKDAEAVIKKTKVSLKKFARSAEGLERLSDMILTRIK